MDRSTVNMLRELIQVSLDAMEDDVKEQFLFKLGNCRYSSTDATFKLEVLDKEASNGAESIEAARFKQNCSFYGFKESDLGKKFYFNGEFYRLLGWLKGKKRYPIQVERTRDGKKFRMPPESVKSGLYAFKSKTGTGA